MKTIILSAMLFLSGLSFGQSPTKFELIDSGMTSFVVTEVDNKSASEIFSKTIDWINKTYKTPKDVIEGNVKDNYIRFQGVKKQLSCFLLLGNKMCQDSKYSIEINIKDGKYKFTVIELLAFTGLSKDYPTGWRTDKISTKEERENKKGEIKARYQYEIEIPEHFNYLNEDLKKYIESGEKLDEKSDW